MVRLRITVLLVLIAACSGRYLVTFAPAVESIEKQDGRAFIKLLCDQYIALEQDDTAQIVKGFQALKMYRHREFSKDFFAGIRDCLKEFDLKQFRQTLEEQSYARFLVLFYFVECYAQAALSDCIDINTIYQIAYEKAAQSAFGNVTPEYLRMLKKSVEDYEQLISEKFS